VAGLGPATCGLAIRRSIPLSYTGFPQLRVFGGTFLRRCPLHTSFSVRPPLRLGQGVVVFVREVRHSAQWVGVDNLCDNERMPKRSRMPADLNSLAAQIVKDATSDDAPPDDGKNPAAVELGRRGGKKGGKARAAALTPERRKEIAQAAAAKRWRKKEPST
jgi:hypothetical protein